MFSFLRKPFFKDIIEIAILIVVVVIPFRIFIAEPYIVSGISMSDTYETGHYLIINKFWHKLSDIERGDVLVFRSPNEDNKFYIKRVIALPGETIDIQDTVVSITPVGATNSFILEEPYVKNNTYATLTSQLQDGQYFMMGDNRANSFDSRAWGALDESAIRGEPVLRLFPFNHITLMPGRVQ